MSDNDDTFQKTQIVRTPEEIKRHFLELVRLYAKDGTCPNKFCQCGECGYEGNMPVSRKEKVSILGALAQIIFGLVITVLAGIELGPHGMLFVAILFIVFGPKEADRRVYFVCPSCDSELGPVSPSET